jgi:hypothetical protein
MCINEWLKQAGACPTCRQLLENTDIIRLQGTVLKTYEGLRLSCRKCEEYFEILLITDHEKICKEKRKTRGPSLKNDLKDMNPNYIRNKRLKPLIDEVKSFCSSKLEDETDVLFFMLKDCLERHSDARAKSVKQVWNGAHSQMTPEECLSMRVDTLQSKNQYKKQYSILCEKSVNVLQPPTRLNEEEKKYVPGACRYSLEGHEYIDSFYHTPAKSTTDQTHPADNIEPCNIKADFVKGLPDLYVPNCEGVIWPYPDAIAKTLEELIEVELIPKLMEKHIDITPQQLFKVFIKDGGDGLGDVSIYKEKGDKALPDKALRYSFCVLQIELGDKVIYEDLHPNSVRSNRPLLEALADENDKGSSTLCTSKIIAQREFVANKIMRVQHEQKWWRFEIKFFNSMLDEKYDRAEGGLAGSGTCVPSVMPQEKLQKQTSGHLLQTEHMMRPAKLVKFYESIP